MIDTILCGITTWFDKPMSQYEMWWSLNEGRMIPFDSYSRLWHTNEEKTRHFIKIRSIKSKISIHVKKVNLWSTVQWLTIKNDTFISNIAFYPLLTTLEASKTTTLLTFLSKTSKNNENVTFLWCIGPFSGFADTKSDKKYVNQIKSQTIVINKAFNDKDILLSGLLRASFGIPPPHNCLVQRQKANLRLSLVILSHFFSIHNK